MATTLSISDITADGMLRAQYDHRSSLQKTVDLVFSLFRQMQYSLAVFHHRVFCSTPQYGEHKIEWQSDSRGLVVLIHGLSNSPSAWYSQLSLLHQHRQIDVFAPSVSKKGICSLEEAVTPILPVILDYARKNPEKPLCLVRVSNGSRIATWLETKLRQDSPRTPIMVSTIAGVHFGSRLMDHLEELGVAKWLYPDVLRQELKYGSDTAKELLHRVATPLPENCAHRAYEFYASTEDLFVPELDSSLPTLNKGERYHVVHGHSHSSIVSAVAKHQIDSCLQWINKFQESTLSLV